MFEQYYPLFLVFMLAGGLVALITALSTFVGPKKKNRNKYKAFECGSEQVSDTRGRFSIKFYVVAIIFIIFDIETVFLYPWAVLYRASEVPGWAALMFVEMLVFIVILGVGLAYAWRKGALEWE